MNNFSQPHQPTYVPQPPPKSNKKVWIILSIIIGVAVLAMGSCAACVAVLDEVRRANHRTPPPRIQNINATLDEGIIWHDVYFTNEGSRDLHEVNVSISLVGEKGEQRTESRNVMG